MYLIELYWTTSVGFRSPWTIVSHSSYSLDLCYRLFNVEIHESGAPGCLENEPHASHLTIIENTFVVSAILFDIIIVRPGADLVPLRTPGSKFQESSACGFLPTASLRNSCQLRCSFELPGSYLSLVGYENLINLFRDGRSWKYKGLTFGMLVTLRGFKRLSHW